MDTDERRVLTTQVVRQVAEEWRRLAKERRTAMPPTMELPETRWVRGDWWVHLVVALVTIGLWVGGIIILTGLLSVLMGLERWFRAP